VTTFRTNLEFRSNAFPAKPGVGERINPGRWGAALARFLREGLLKRGMATAEAVAEDWGYCISIENPDFNLWAEDMLAMRADSTDARRSTSCSLGQLRATLLYEWTRDDALWIRHES
jgi:hypothetical protein